jgi:molybdate transport system substrate-binding protein
MAAASGTTADIRVLSAAAMAEIVRDLGDAYHGATGVKLSAEFTRSPLVFDRVRSGEIVDIVITTQSRVEKLAKENKVGADSTAIVARSGIGVAVRAGRPKLAISSIGAFIATLRSANSIAFADPAFGTASGLYLVELFDRLGLTEELKPKMRLIGAVGGKPVVVCGAVADGKADLGIQQIAEIISVPGVDLVGPLPPEIQQMTVFAGAVASVAQNTGLARDFVTFLTSEAAKAVIVANGMEPA